MVSQPTKVWTHEVWKPWIVTMNTLKHQGLHIPLMPQTQACFSGKGIAGKSKNRPEEGVKCPIGF